MFRRHVVHLILKYMSKCFDSPFVLIRSNLILPRIDEKENSVALWGETAFWKDYTLISFKIDASPRVSV